MGMLSRKLLNLAQYAGIRSPSYYHAEAAANYDPDDPLAYYLDHTARAGYSGPHDQDGIPQYEHKGQVDYLPVLASLIALGHCDRYRRSGDAGDRAALIRIARWFVQSQTGDGRWLTPFPMPKYGLDAPFTSAMAQGMGISTLVRAYLLEKHEDFVMAARKGLAVFEVPVAAGGVRTETGGEVFYEEYPSDPPHHVLNGFIYAVWGLWDLVRLENNAEAKNLWDAGLSTLTAWLPRFDMGYWSRYHISDGMENPATIPYHKLHIEQLKVMYHITADRAFEEFANRWEGYLRRRTNALRTLPSKIKWNLLRGF